MKIFMSFPHELILESSPGHEEPGTENRTERIGNWNRKNRNRKNRFLFGSRLPGTELPRFFGSVPRLIERSKERAHQYIEPNNTMAQLAESPIKITKP
jgi:hypothetical protein